MGRELVLQLLTKGAKVAMADINAEGMDEAEKLAGERAKNLSKHMLDISEREKVHAFPEQVIAAHDSLDGIINNAGIIQPFIEVNELDNKKIERIININFYGTLYMAKAFLPYLLERSEAHIVNVSSMGGFIPFPGQTFYGASKAVVKLLTEGLYAKLKDTNVHVTVIHPGAAITNITKNSGVEMRSGSDASAQSHRTLPADKATEIMIKAMKKNKYRVMVGTDDRFLDIMYRLNPKKAVHFIVKQMGSLKS